MADGAGGGEAGMQGSTREDDFPTIIETPRHGSEVVEVIPVLREIAHIGTREVETGRVRVHKTVRERDEAVEVMLRQEDLEVERVAVGREVSEAPAPWQDGDTYVIPVVEEILVVEKRLVLKEELRIRTRRSEKAAQETVRLRSEEIEVETLPGIGRAGAGTDTAENDHGK